jgi:redox-sensing transcriptional repressor
MGELMGYTASQIRQDLNNFGGFGQQGYGYNVEALHEEITGILGLKNHYTMVIIGIGNLGHAVANYTNYYSSEFEIKAMFDINPQVVGSMINGIEVRDAGTLPDWLKTHATDIGIIATSSQSAQGIADVLTAGGVKGIWNFTISDLSLPADVSLQNVRISDSLHALAYYINNR